MDLWLETFVNSARRNVSLEKVYKEYCKVEDCAVFFVPSLFEFKRQVLMYLAEVIEATETVSEGFRFVYRSVEKERLDLKGGPAIPGDNVWEQDEIDKEIARGLILFGHKNNSCQYIKHFFGRQGMPLQRFTASKIGDRGRTVFANKLKYKTFPGPFIYCKISTEHFTEEMLRAAEAYKEACPILNKCNTRGQRKSIYINW